MMRPLLLTTLRASLVAFLLAAAPAVADAQNQPHERVPVQQESSLAMDFAPDERAVARPLVNGLERAVRDLRSLVGRDNRWIELGELCCCATDFLDSHRTSKKSQVVRKKNRPSF